MPILTHTEWASFTGKTLSAAEAISAAAICLEVGAAIHRKCRPWRFESATLTDTILDAPIDDVLLLPVLPVRSIASLYLRAGASGDASLFTSDYLLTNYTDYLLDIDDPLNGWSRSGIVRSRRSRWGGFWGVEHRFPMGRLTGEPVPARGAIKVTFTAGTTSVPEDVRLAANLAVSMIFDRRVKGMPQTSESWNGWSGSWSGPYTAEAALNSPDVQDHLSGYCSLTVGKA